MWGDFVMGWICGKCGGKSEILGYVKQEKFATMFRKCQNCGAIVASHNLILSKDGRLRGKDLSGELMFKNFVETFDTKRLFTFDCTLEMKK